VELSGLRSSESVVDYDGLDLFLMSWRGVCRASIAETLLRFVSNQTPMELEVGRRGGRGNFPQFEVIGCQVLVGQGPVWLGRWCWKTGGIKRLENRNVVRTCRGQGIGPFCKIRNKEGGGKGQVYIPQPAHKGHRKPGVDPRRVD